MPQPGVGVPKCGYLGGRREDSTDVREAATRTTKMSSLLLRTGGAGGLEVLTASLPAVQNMSAEISPCSTIVATFLEGGKQGQIFVPAIEYSTHNNMAPSSFLRIPHLN